MNEMVLCLFFTDIAYLASAQEEVGKSVGDLASGRFSRNTHHAIKENMFNRRSISE
jgi:hypothetical protein